MRRLVRAAAALVALAALLVGLPVALARFVGRPWPSPMPSLDTIWHAVRAGDISDTTVVKALALVVWIAWARLTVAVVIEVLARLGGQPAPRVGVLGSAQHWAAAMIAAVTLVGVAPRPALAHSASTPRPIPAALLQRADADHARLPNRHERQFEHASSVAGHATRGAHTTERANGSDHTSVPERARVLDRTGAPTIDEGGTARTTVHVVRRYESFWSIAEDTVGDGSRWREIVELNAGREVSPGVTFDGTANRLLPGWLLLVPDVSLHEPIAVPADEPVVGPAPSSHDVAAATGAGGPRTVLVQPGDTLSGIAAEQLGDPLQWRELWETNRGHEFNGRVFDDPNLILTGWELIVPAAFAPPAPAVEAPDAPVVEVSPPAALPTPAPAGAPAPVVETATSPLPAPSPSSPAVTPIVDLADAAPVAVLPAPTIDAETPDEAPRPPTGAADVMAPPPVVVPATGPLPAAVDPQPGSTAEADQPAAALGGIGAAVLLASGVLGAVGVRRRRQLRSAVVNARLAPPSPTSVSVEHGLRRLGEGERIARLDIALRAAARQLLDVSPGAAILGALMTDDGQIDLLLSGSASAAPPPWTVVTGHRWRLPSAVPITDLADAARQSNQPCPGIAHLGSTPLDALQDADLFIDLEAIGLLAVDGPPAESAAIVRAIAAGVSMSPMAEIAHIIISGFDAPVLGHPSTQATESLDVALDLAASAIGVTAGVTAGATSTFVLRARHQGGEAWEPALVLASDAGGGDDSGAVIADSDLVDLAGTGGRGLAVVVDRAVAGATWSIRPGPQHWCLAPLGLELTPIGLSALDIERIETLLEEADRPLLPPPPSIDPLDVRPDRMPDPELPWTLMVRLLGPVEVMSADLRTVAFERSKALELVVWLTQHRDRSTRTGARTALWESNVRDATFANVVSDARRNLARLEPPADGEEWVGRTLTEELPLHPLVVTDSDILSDRLRACRGVAPDAAIAVLRPALSLIRDMPFAGTSYLWPDSEGITSQLTLLATSAATVLAGHYLTIGDTDGVFWATGQGLKVLPGHEELIALRMRAHGRHGDLAGVRREWESYERVLVAEAWSDGEPSPKLVALRRELLSLR